MGPSYEQFCKKYSQFIDKNDDLVSRYEVIFGNIDMNTYELYQQYISIYNSTPTSVDIVMSRAVLTAINEKVDILTALDRIRTDSTCSNKDKSTLQVYFDKINEIYLKNDNNYDIEYCPENREKLIEMNLKSVISVAKMYQGLGVSLEDLISAGNVGLCEAFDKYNPERARLKEHALAAIEPLENEVTLDQLKEALSPYLKYGDIKKKFNNSFNNENTIYSKTNIEHWINSNVKNAKFNSVAIMWIRAYILIEISNNSRLVKKPKGELQKDKTEFGCYKKEQLLDIDAPVNGESGAPLSDILNINGEEITDLDVDESRQVFKDCLNKLLDGVKSRDRRVVLQKFGIGLPRPMIPKEIADREGLSIARVSQIIQNVLETMRINQKRYNIDEHTMYDALEKMR